MYSHLLKYFKNLPFDLITIDYCTFLDIYILQNNVATQ